MTMVSSSEKARHFFRSTADPSICQVYSFISECKENVSFRQSIVNPNSRHKNQALSSSHSDIFLCTFPVTWNFFPSLVCHSSEHLSSRLNNPYVTIKSSDKHIEYLDHSFQMPFLNKKEQQTSP